MNGADTCLRLFFHVLEQCIDLEMLAQKCVNGFLSIGNPGRSERFLSRIVHVLLSEHVPRRFGRLQSQSWSDRANVSMPALYIRHGIARPMVYRLKIHRMLRPLACERMTLVVQPPSSW